MDKGVKFYPTDDQATLCVSCWFARMRTDICGIYCTGGFVKPDGTCDKYADYDRVKREKRRRK